MQTHQKNPPVLNSEQEKAARAPMGPLLIVAGAGTGKTSTLTSRIIYLIQNGVPPNKICAITFTNKASLEMTERVTGQKLNTISSHQQNTRPYIGTFHSLGAKILRKECRLLNREQNFIIFDDRDSFDLIKKAVRNTFPREKNTIGKSIKKEKKDESPAFFAEKIAEIKNNVFLKKSHRAEISPEKESQIWHIFSLYEESLERNNAFDFDDLIAKPVALFNKSSMILKKYQAMFDAILVDEWQDINPIQYEFVKLLAGEHRNLSVVGDDEQTIYTWRYADIKTFLDFDKEWKDASVYFLEENYRSTATIVNAAQAVVQNNRFRTPKKLRTANPDGDAILLFEAWGENDEAAWIARNIKKIQALHPQWTIGILYRTNAQSRAIEQSLIRQDISYRIFGGLKFYERREVKDAIAALRYAANKKDEISRERLEKNLSRRRFAEFQKAIISLKDPAPTDVLSLFIEKFGYFDYLEENFINASEREENISELASFIKDFETLAELLEKISLVQSTDAPSSKTDMDKNKRGTQDESVIHLSTIHLAKGLEFDAVFISGTAEGILPHIRSIDSEDQIEEERRLLYVAMTRAKKELYISFFGMPSRFLSEIPLEYIRNAKNDEENISGEETLSYGNNDDDLNFF